MLMPNKLFPRLRPNLDLGDLWAAIKPGRSSIERFETAFSNKFGCRHGIMFSHGRSGLYALLKVWGLKNDEIICPAYTCVVVQHAIVLSDNIPVFVDCARDSFNMDCNLLEASITERTRAIIVTHLFGCPMDVDRIQKIVKQAEIIYGHKIFVVQDVAHSYGAKWDGQLVTTYGDAAIFGCNISKMITSVFGGMVISNDSKLKEDLERFREKTCRHSFSKSIRRLLYMIAVMIAFNPRLYSLVNWLENKGFLDQYSKYYSEEKIDFPDDWDEWPCALEARVGYHQLGKYDQIVQARVKNAQKWMSSLGSEHIEFFEYPPGSTFSHCVGLVDDRSSWLKNYCERGYQLGILIEYCVPYMSSYNTYRGNSEFPIALSYSKRAINFPVWRGITIRKSPSKTVIKSTKMEG